MFVMKYKYLYEINTVMCTRASRGVIVKQETKRNNQKRNETRHNRNETR
jgi:hypothetical protein